MMKSIPETTHSCLLGIQFSPSLAIEFAQPAEFPPFLHDLPLALKDAQTPMLSILDAVVQF